jgi:gas vesicle protein
MAEMSKKTRYLAGTASEALKKPGVQETADRSKSKAEEGTSGVVGAAKEKIQEMATSASQVDGNVKDTAEEWASSVGSAAVQAKDKAQEVVGAAAEKVGEVGEEVTALIRRYPLPALLMGVGMGFLLAKILQGPSSAAT